jgi:nucleolar protein 4
MCAGNSGVPDQSVSSNKGLSFTIDFDFLFFSHARQKRKLRGKPFSGSDFIPLRSVRLFSKFSYKTHTHEDEMPLAGTTANTVFVRNLPFDLVSKDLESHFATAAPVKKCVLVTDPVKDQPKGIAFVTFETDDGAKKAIQLFNGAQFQGRPLGVDMAQRKGFKHPEAAQKPKSKDKKKPAKKDSEKDSEKDKKTKKQEVVKAKKPVPKEESSSEEESDSEDDSNSDSQSESSDASDSDRDSSDEEVVAKVDKVTKDAKKGKTERKPVEAAAKVEADDDDDDEGKENGEEAEKKEAKQKKNPVSTSLKIEQNAIVITGVDTAKVTQKHLYKRVRKCGAVVGIEYPSATTAAESTESGDKAETAASRPVKVYFANRADAVDAQAKLDDHVFKGAKLSVSLSVDVPSTEDTHTRLIVRNVPFAATENDLLQAFSAFGTVTEVSLLKGFAFVSMQSDEQAEAAIKGMNGKPVAGREVAVDHAIAKRKYKEALKQKAADPQPEPESSESEDDEKRGSKEDDASDSDKEDNAVKEKKDDDYEKLLFVRNLPFDTTEDILKEYFSTYGPVRYARIVMDRVTQHSKGSGFVCFFNAEDAAKLFNMITEGNESARLEYHNNHSIYFCRALSRTTLSSTVDDKKKKREKEDKRNLYLAKEGLVIADDISKEDKEKRDRAWAEKKAKLANPNFYISKTRLSVRNLPKDVDQYRLKEIVKKEVGDRYLGLVQCKVVQGVEKGRMESRGFGFLEFKEHEKALEVLRALNNNPRYFSKAKRLIVEFAVEDVRKVKLVKRHQEVFAQKSQQGYVDSKDRSYGKGQKRDRTDADSSRDGSKFSRRDKDREEPAAKRRRTDSVAGSAADADAADTPKPEPKFSRWAPRNSDSKSSSAATSRPQKQQQSRQQPSQQQEPRKQVQKKEDKRDAMDDYLNQALRAEDAQMRDASKKERHAGKKRERAEEAKFESMVEDYRRQFSAGPADSDKSKEKGKKKWFDTLQ